MKIVHFSNYAPRESGMYESVKDQIKYERREGAESIIINAHNEEIKEGTIDDNWLTPSPWDDAKDADIWVMHSFIPEPLREMKSEKVTIAILHGPTEHMLIKEWSSGRKEQSFDLHIRILWQYDATVVINQHELDIMELYDEHDRIHYIPNSIDLERYEVKDNDYKWNYIHRPAIISCDVNRIEKLPAHIIWSMPRIAAKIPDARLNLFSMSLEPIATFRNIFCKAKERKLEALCENIQLKNNDLRIFMAGADIAFNNNMSGILSRVGMELMAMGIPIVSYNGDYTRFKCRIWDLDSIARQIELCWKDLSSTGSTLRQDTIAYAQKHFDRSKEVKKYMALYKKLLNEKYPNKRFPLKNIDGERKPLKISDAIDSKTSSPVEENSKTDD